MAPFPLVLGLDGYPGGWICVALSEGCVEGVIAAPSIDYALGTFPGAAVAGIDMPFALTARGPRRADGAARMFVRPRGSSVFAVPPLATFTAASHAEAVALAREHGGPAPSAQCFALFARIREAALAFEQGAPLYEVHPEVSFRALAGRPLASKRSWNGMRARLAALEAAGIAIPAEVDDGIPTEDLLDATVVAWSAARIARGEARTLPEEPAAEERAARMLVWY